MHSHIKATRCRFNARRCALCGHLLCRQNVCGECNVRKSHLNECACVVHKHTAVHMYAYVRHIMQKSSLSKGLYTATSSRFRELGKFQWLLCFVLFCFLFVVCCCLFSLSLLTTLSIYAYICVYPSDCELRTFSRLFLVFPFSNIFWNEKYYRRGVIFRPHI